MENIRNFESIIFYKMQKTLMKFAENKNCSLFDCYNLAAVRKPLDTKGALNADLYHTVCLLSFELIALATENFDQTSLNFSDPKINDMLRSVKQNLPPEYKTMNGAELLKLIRSSIAHNSMAIQNTYTNDMKDYEITLNKKHSPGAPYCLSLVELLETIEAYDKCRVMDHVHGAIEHYNLNSVKDLLSHYKKHHTFSNALIVYDSKGNIVPIDKHQDAAFFRFLRKHESLINMSKDFGHYMMRYFPLKDNKLNHYEHKSQLSMTTALLLDLNSSYKDMQEKTFIDYMSKLKPEQRNKLTNYNVCCNDFIKALNKIDFHGAMPYIDKEFMESLFASSIAFNICSNRTNDELYDLFKRAGHETDIDTIRHFRNSLIHGRYFYNYNGGFEMYDGQKELEHFGTLTFNTINDIFKTYAHNQIVDIVKQRDKIDIMLKFQEKGNVVIIKPNSTPENEL